MIGRDELPIYVMRMIGMYAVSPVAGLVDPHAGRLETQTDAVRVLVDLIGAIVQTAATTERLTGEICKIWCPDDQIAPSSDRRRRAYRTTTRPM